MRQFQECRVLQMTQSRRQVATKLNEKEERVRVRVDGLKAKNVAVCGRNRKHTTLTRTEQTFIITPCRSLSLRY